MINGHAFGHLFQQTGEIIILAVSLFAGLGYYASVADQKTLAFGVVEMLLKEAPNDLRPSDDPNKKPCNVRKPPPFPVQRGMPSIISRPAILNMVWAIQPFFSHSCSRN